MCTRICGCTFVSLIKLHTQRTPPTCTHHVPPVFVLLVACSCLTTFASTTGGMIRSMAPPCGRGTRWMRTAATNGVCACVCVCVCYATAAEHNQLSCCCWQPEGKTLEPTLTFILLLFLFFFPFSSEYLYTRDELEEGKTHDDLWNAAQLQASSRCKVGERGAWPVIIPMHTRSHPQNYSHTHSHILSLSRCRWLRGGRCMDSSACIGQRRFSSGLNRPRKRWPRPFTSTTSTSWTAGIQTVSVGQGGEGKNEGGGGEQDAWLVRFWVAWNAHTNVLLSPTCRLRWVHVVDCWDSRSGLG